MARIPDGARDHGDYSSFVTVRPNGDGTIDEIITGPVDSLHIEQLDTGVYWMAIEKGGEIEHVTFFTSPACRHRLYVGSFHAGRRRPTTEGEE